MKSKISHNRAFLCHFLLCHSTSVYLSCYVLVFFIQNQTLLILFDCFLRYGGITVGNIQKSVPASFERKKSLMARKIAVRRSAQVS